MKTTIARLVNLSPSLKRLGAEPLPVKTSYALAKMIKKVQAELEIYDSERIKLCEKYGRKNKQGYDIDESKMSAFNSDYEELLQQEAEIDYEPIALPDNVTISASDLLALEEFIKLEE